MIHEDTGRATAAELVSALDRTAETPAAGAGRKHSTSVAVLPFANLAGPESEYLSDGISEELMQALGEIEGLLVVRQTAQRYELLDAGSGSGPNGSGGRPIRVRRAGRKVLSFSR